MVTLPFLPQESTYISFADIIVQCNIYTNFLDIIFYAFLSSFNKVNVSSNSSVIAGLSLYVNRLTTTVTISPSANPGTISYKLSDRYFIFPQMMTVIAPVIMPDIAPRFVIFRQYKESKIIGPKDAPKPAQANDTSFKIVPIFVQAKPRAIKETNNTDILPNKT